MKYTAKSFTIAPSGSYEQAHAICDSAGHMSADVRGKCLRCAEPIEQGHVRLETDGSHDTTHRGRTPADVTTP